MNGAGSPVNGAGRNGGSGRGDAAVVVAVAGVRMVQVAVDEVVHVVTVGHGVVAAARTMHVVAAVAGAGVLRRAGGRVVGVHREDVLVDVAVVRMVQVAVVQVVDVAVVLDGAMAAVRAVLMGVVGVDAMV